MGFLGFCGVCCMCLSIWAVLQLSFMGYFYYIETPILIEDVEEHHPADFQDFIKKTRKNYQQNARNCWATAGIYFLTLILSLLCIRMSNASAKVARKKMEDDELACITIMPKPPQTVDAIVGKRGKKSKSKSKQAPQSDRIRDARKENFERIQQQKRDAKRMGK